MLSQYVIEGQDDQGGLTWFHTVLQEHLSQNASEDVLREHLFMRDQNEEALNKWLFQDGQSVALNMEVTRLCNLRCSHCFVLERLTSHDDVQFDFAAYRKFLVDLKNRGHRSFKFLLSGGEVLIKPDKCKRIVDDAKSTLTDCDLVFDLNTNGVHDPSEEIKSLLSLFDRIGISVDGLKEQHESQRKPYGFVDESVYDKTLTFIKWMINEGLGDRLHVKASMKDEHFSLENKKGFLREMIRCGVDIDRITFGRQYPTEHSMKESVGLQSLLQKKGMVNLDACCRFRFMRNFFIGSGGEIYSGNFFPSNTSNLLGSLGDPLEAIEARYREVVMTCPALQDQTCRECPALGMCWGGCFWADPLIGDRPSQWCNQSLTIQRVREYAQKSA